MVIDCPVCLRSADADRASHSCQQMYVARSDRIPSSRPSRSSFLPRLCMRCRTRAPARTEILPSTIGWNVPACAASGKLPENPSCEGQVALRQPGVTGRGASRDRSLEPGPSPGQLVAGTDQYRVPALGCMLKNQYHKTFTIAILCGLSLTKRACFRRSFG